MQGNISNISITNYFRVSLSGSSIVKTRELAENVMGIKLVEEKIVKQETSEPQKTKDVRCHPNKKLRSAPQRIASKRPLLMKSLDNQAPIVFIMPGSVQSYEKYGQTPQNIEDPATLNSYQKAKIRCADKFKCDICGKGFPLDCLLQRHLKTHFDNKSFKCRHCDKGFSSKSSLRHHVFIKHLEDRHCPLTSKLEVTTQPHPKPFILESQGREERSENIEIINVKVDDLSKHVEVQITEADAEEVTHKAGGGRSVIVSPGEARAARGQETAQKINDNTASNMYYWI